MRGSCHSPDGRQGSNRRSWTPANASPDRTSGATLHSWRFAAYRQPDRGTGPAITPTSPRASTSRNRSTSSRRSSGRPDRCACSVRGTPSTTSPTRPASSSRSRRMPRVFDLDPASGTVTVDGGGPLRRALRTAARRRVRAAQPRLAAAHLGGRCLRDGHPWLGRSQREPRDRRRRPWRSSPRTARSSPSLATAIRTPSTAPSSPSGPRRGHVAHARGPADVPDATGPLRGSPLTPGRRALRRDHLERRQREPVHRLARTGVRAGLAQAPRSRADDYEPSPDLFGATVATVPIHPIRRMPPDALHRAARRRRPVARTLAALPHGPHAERRRRAPDRVPDPAAPRRRGTAGDRSRPRPVRAARSRSPRCARSRPTTCG